MARSMNGQKGEITTALHQSGLLTIKLKILETDLVERLLARPLQRFGPGMVAKPVADEIGIALDFVP